MPTLPEPAPGNWQVAHIDESSAVHADGSRIYVVGAVLSTDEHEAGLKDRLHAALRPGQEILHWNADRDRARRVELAHRLAGCSFTGALLVARMTSNKKQEDTRKKILNSLLPDLQWQESAQHVVIESRHQGDVHDHKTIARLRSGKLITAQMRIDHVRKREDPRLWLADALVSCYVSAHVHGETEPWEILDASHCIDVRGPGEPPGP